MQQLPTDWKVRGSNRGMDKGISFLRNRSHRMCSPPSLLLNGYRGYYLLFIIKRPRSEFDHSNLAPSFYSTRKTFLSLTAANYVRSCDLPVLYACSDIVSYLKYGQPCYKCSSHAVCRASSLMSQYVHSSQFLSRIIPI